MAETTRLVQTSRIVSNFTGIQVPPNKAVVGPNAFAHEAGIHQHGMLRHQSTYEIMRPEDVGMGGSRLVLGKHSGRHAFRDRVQALGLHLDEAELDRAFIAFKQLADRKKEVFDDDLIALMRVGEDAENDRLKLKSLAVSCGTGGPASARMPAGSRSTPRCPIT